MKKVITLLIVKIIKAEQTNHTVPSQDSKTSSALRFIETHENNNGWNVVS
jgi:hypothetical protein